MTEFQRAWVVSCPQHGELCRLPGGPTFTVGPCQKIDRDRSKASGRPVLCGHNHDVTPAYDIVTGL